MLVFSHLLSSLDCGRRRASEIHWPLMAAGSGHLGMNKTSKSTNCDWRQDSEMHWPLLVAGSRHLRMNKTSKSTNCDWRQDSEMHWPLLAAGSGHLQNIKVNHLWLKIKFRCTGHSWLLAQGIWAWTKHQSTNCDWRQDSEMHWPLLAAGSGHLQNIKVNHLWLKIKFRCTGHSWLLAQDIGAWTKHQCQPAATEHKLQHQSINCNRKRKEKMKYYKHSICCIIIVRQVKPAGMTSSKNTAKTIIISWNPVLTNNQITTSITKARANEMFSPSHWKQN